MDTDTLIILVIIAVFAVYVSTYMQESNETFEQQTEELERTSGDFSPVEQHDKPPCYIVKSVDTNDNAKNVMASNYDVYEKEANFDSEYTNMIDYFGTNAKKVEEKKYYETITSADITPCAAPTLQQAEYATSAF